MSMSLYKTVSRSLLLAMLAVALPSPGTDARPNFMKGGHPTGGAPPVLSETGFVGVGKTTLNCSDWDGDGYGTGPGCTSVDADDDDPAVNTAATFEATYASVGALLAKRGYTGILRYWFLDYVNGNDTTCVAGTEAVAKAAPCLTMARINVAYASNLLPGDVVVIRGGQSPHSQHYGLMGDTGWAGTATNPIVFVSYPGEAVILDGTVGQTDVFDVYSTSHLIFDGFKITLGPTSGNGRGFYFRYSSDFVVRNIEVFGGYAAMWQMEGGHNFTIERNFFHEDKASHSMYLGSTPNPNSNVTVRHNIIKNSTVWDSGYPAFQHNGRVTNLVIEGNIIYGFEQCLAFLNGVSYSTIRNNLCFGGAAALITIWLDGANQLAFPDCSCPEWGICPYPTTDNVVENNTLVRGAYDRTGYPAADTGVFNFTMSTHCEVGDLSRHTIRNNVIWGHGPTVVFNWPSDTLAQAQANLSSWTMTNNLIYNESPADPKLMFAIGGASRTEATVAPWFQTYSGNITVQPQFVSYDQLNWSDPSLSNFHPLPTSPLVGAGTTTGATLDIQRKPQHVPPNIGAYATTETPP
jgi:hypothetical protein